jgi:hypothetical protein
MALADLSRLRLQSLLSLSTSPHGEQLKILECGGKWV